MRNAKQLPSLVDSFDRADTDEVSVVRPRLLVTLLDPKGDEPVPIYCSLVVERSGRAARRSYFLGTHFPLGVIEAEAWQREMRSDAVAEATIAELERWLADRTL